MASAAVALGATVDEVGNIIECFTYEIHRQRFAYVAVVIEFA